MRQLAEVDDGAFPFVVSVMPKTPDEAFFRRYFAAQRALLERRERWVHLVDTRLVLKLPDANVRHLVTQFTNELKPLSSRYNVGTAVLLQSAIVRGIMTAIHWVAPPPHPLTAAASAEEAIAFLASCCDRVGMPAPRGMTLSRAEAAFARVSATRSD